MFKKVVIWKMEGEEWVESTSSSFSLHGYCYRLEGYCYRLGGYCCRLEWLVLADRLDNVL